MLHYSEHFHLWKAKVKDFKKKAKAQAHKVLLLMVSLSMLFPGVLGSIPQELVATEANRRELNPQQPAPQHKRSSNIR